MLYIRHSYKAYSNGKSNEYSLDPGLTDEGKKIAIQKFQQLLTEYESPSKIISSPYLRARETARIAHDVILEIKGKSVEILYDPLIGEYLGHHKNKDIQQCLRPETLIHNPTPPESWIEYSKRVRNHIDTKPSDCWVITHGIVIQSISYFNGNKVPHPSELTGIYIDKNGMKIIQ